MTRLEKLKRQAQNLEAFIAKIKAFPVWYLETEAQKKMTKKDLREFYLGRKEV